MLEKNAMYTMDSILNKCVGTRGTEPVMPLQNRIRKQKLSYFGHVARANGLENFIILERGEGS